jgi:transcription initiation factor TFIIB
VRFARLGEAHRSLCCENTRPRRPYFVNTAKLYSPLFVRTFANNHNLRTTYKSIKRRQTQRLQGKVGGRVIKNKSQAPAIKVTKMTTPGVENHPPDAPAWRPNLNTHLICPDCKQNPPDLVEENADTICANCGRVLAERLISYESEWRTFNSDEGKGDDPNRVGEADNDLLNASNVGTMIGGGGANVSKETRKLKKAQALQQENKADKALQAAYAQIEAWGERAQLTFPIKNSAKGYYKRVYEANALRGKPLEVILAGCLFIACRQNKAPRSFSEIFGLTSVPKKDIGRVYKNLEKFLMKWSNDSIQAIEEGGGVANQSIAYSATASTRPDQLCERYNNMLGGPFRVGRIAAELAQKTTPYEELAGRSPLSIAAACVYFASHLLGLGKSTKQIGEVASVSEATIKGAYKQLYLEREKLVEQSWLGKQDKGFGDMKNLPST